MNIFTNHCLYYYYLYYFTLISMLQIKNHIHIPISNTLKLQQVWLVAVLQAERGSQVLLQQWGLLDLSQQRSVDLLLVSNSLSLDLSWAGGLLKESSLRLLFSGWLLSSEVCDVVLGGVDTRDGNLGGGGNDVTRVDSSQWNTVNLEWTRNQQGTVLERLQVDDSLTSESTGQQNQNGTWDQGGTQFLWTSNVSVLLWDWSVLRLVPLLRLNC